MKDIYYLDNSEQLRPNSGEHWQERIPEFSCRQKLTGIANSKTSCPKTS